MEITKKQTEKVEQGEKITRKQAIKKAGVTALAASSLLLLNSPANAVSSQNNGHGNLDQTPPGNSGPHNNAENSGNSGEGNSGQGQGGHGF